MPSSSPESNREHARRHADRMRAAGLSLLGGVWLRKEVHTAISSRAKREGKPSWMLVAEILEKEFLSKAEGAENDETNLCKHCGGGRELQKR